MSTSTAPITKRLLAIFDSATDLQKKNGNAWYVEAYTYAFTLCGSDFTVEQTAGVIAVLSPNTAWNANKLLAKRVIDAFRDGIPAEDSRGGLGANVRKAYRILDGDLSAVSGPKVTAFYNNILGCPDHVTVDIWATRAAVGRDVPGTDHVRIVKAYRNAAKLRGLTPRDFQAVVWVTVRNKQLELF